MMRDASSLFVIAVVALALMIGAAWVYSRYHAAPSDKIGFGLTEMP